MMNHREGPFSSAVSLVLVVIGLVVCVLAGSLIAAILSAIPLLLSGSTISSFSALAKAAMESQSWMIVAEAIRCVACIGLIALMVVRFDKRPFRFASVGIAWKPNPALMILAGFSLTFALVLGAEGLALARGLEGSIPRLFGLFPEVIPGAIGVVALGAVVNAFWQELAFRGYLQGRFQRSYGTLPGIVLCSFIFVVLHGLVRPVSVSEVVTGTVFFCLVGWLYFVSRSIALATALHAAGNFYLRLLGTHDISLPQPLDRGVAYSVGLLAAVLVFRGHLASEVRPGTDQRASEA